VKHGLLLRRKTVLRKISKFKKDEMSEQFRT